MRVEVELLQDMIRNRRAVLGLTQDEVAKALGVTQPLVHAWETGRCSPSQTHLNAFLKMLGLSVQIKVEVLDYMGEGDREPRLSYINYKYNGPREKARGCYRTLPVFSDE